MADGGEKRPSGRNGLVHQVKANPPFVLNHHQMLKEIRDNLKHLRRESENTSDGKETDAIAKVIYTSSQNLPPSHVNQRIKQPRLQPRNNFREPRNGLDAVQGNRTNEESGYSSSSSECSSLSANDLNGGQQFVGNMPFYNEDVIHQGLFSPSNFDFVRAMAHNDGYQRINGGGVGVGGGGSGHQRRDVPSSIAPMQFRGKSPPPYRVATQKTNFNGSSDMPMSTNYTSNIETSKYMQKTSLPSGTTTISQAEWKVTSVPEMTSGTGVPLARSVLPEGGAVWKSRPYSVGQKQLPGAPPTSNQGNFHMNPYQQPQQTTPQFQVQVSLNTPNVNPTNISPVVSKSSPNEHSATFRVSVKTSPVTMANESHEMPNSRLSGMQPVGNYPGAMRPEPVMDYRENPHFRPMLNNSSSNLIAKPHLKQHNPPPYVPVSYRAPPPPCDSSQSSESEMRLFSSQDQLMEEQRSDVLQQWSHRNAPSADMSMSSSGSESHSSTIEEEDFAEFDRASLASQDDEERGEPTVYTNETGTLVVHVRGRPTLALDENAMDDGNAATADAKTDPIKGQRLTPEAYKFYMEQRVENLLKARDQREQRRVQLEEEMRKVQLSEEAQSQMRKILNQKETNYIRLKRTKMHPSMFEKLQVIGVGAFGEVCLARHVHSGSLYAMKILKKAEVLKRNQVAHVKAERDILAEADNEWVVKLFYSFQDSDNLYFVMEYVPGGDLMSLLIKFGVFGEDMARFYVAELVLAIESVHKMGFIHRDIKPDNVLVDRDGHIKLTDFGLCTGFRWTHDSKYYQNGTLSRNNHSRTPSGDIDDSTWAKERNCKCRCGFAVDGKKPLGRRHIRQHMRCQAHSLVGTPNYIAPEVLARIPYTHLCDWWSVGVILYEMLVGQPPFYAPNAVETQMKVINWETTLQIPRQAKLSSEAEDLILRLCNSANQRLGVGGVDDIKNHPFFHGIDWVMIRRAEAYYVPQIRHAEDTSNFDPVEPERPNSGDCQSMTEADETKPRHPSHAFYEFTFRRFFTKDQARSSVSNYSSWDETESDENKGPVFV